MKIKLPLVEIETSKEYTCSDDRVRDLKVKCVKMKLHSMYLAVIATIICVWLFSIKTYGNNEFVGQVSFAGTITSIILSVLAIIMSITGEGKTEHVKEQLESTAAQINESQKAVSEINKSIENNLGQLTEEIKRLGSKVDAVPEKTLTSFKNQNAKSVSFTRNINRNLSYDAWENLKND